MTRPLRVLIVDDTALYRKIVSSVLAEVPDVEVVGVAANGAIAMQMLDRAKPDVLTLDLEMPEMDGLDVLRALRERPDPPAAVMLSAFTSDGADSTIEALRLGAFDFVLKPASGGPAESMAKLRKELIPRLDALRHARATTCPLPGAGRAAPRPAAPPAPRAPVIAAPTTPVDVVAIGVSTGGPDALARVIPALPADLPVPVLIVQHMPPMFTKSLAADLDRHGPLTVREATHGAHAAPGTVWIAPGGRQMGVTRQGTRLALRVTDDAPEHSCKPAVDYLLRDLAANHGGRTLAVILTGMGRDGTDGCRALRARGASIMTQDEASCVVYGMPRSVVEEGLSDAALPLDDIAGAIDARVRRRRAA